MAASACEKSSPFEQQRLAARTGERISEAALPDGSRPRRNRVFLDERRHRERSDAIHGNAGR
jgi:hypothetical protein